jgi:hypothetical protein
VPLDEIRRRPEYEDLVQRLNQFARATSRDA